MSAPPVAMPGPSLASMGCPSGVNSSGPSTMTRPSASALAAPASPTTLYSCQSMCGRVAAAPAAGNGGAGGCWPAAPNGVAWRPLTPGAIGLPFAGTVRSELTRASLGLPPVPVLLLSTDCPEPEAPNSAPMMPLRAWFWRLHGVGVRQAGGGLGWGREEGVGREEDGAEGQGRAGQHGRGPRREG